MSAIAVIKPELRAVSRAATGAKFAQKRAPTSTPMNREEYASLVIRANTMARMGGTRAQKVPYILCTSKK